MLYVNPLSTSYASQMDPAAFSSTRRATALKELEHFFALTLLQEMRKTVDKTPLLNGGQAQQIYEEMFDDAVSGSMAESGQLGIAKMIDEQLKIADLQRKLRVDHSLPGGSSRGSVLPIK